MKWFSLLPHRQTWAFVAGKFITDPIWWFYLFWAPDFLQRHHGLSLMQIAAPITAIYVISDVGSVAGGWLSSSLIKRGFLSKCGPKNRHAHLRGCGMPVVFASLSLGSLDCRAPDRYRSGRASGILGEHVHA